MFTSIKTLTKLAVITDGFLPKIFVLIALPMTIFFALAVPPFEAPDEFAHLFRANQISFGEIIGTKLDERNSGGHVDASYRRLSQIFLQTDAFCQVFHPESIVTASKGAMNAASAIPLTGRREFINCPNTIAYGPFGYIPQAAALALARLSGISALNSFYLARVFNALAAVTTGFFALRMARRGRYVIFCFLTMPISLFLMGSLSQDALLLSGASLVIAIASKALSTDRAPNLATYIALVILVVALAWGRLPYLLLGFVFLLKPFDEMFWRDHIFKLWPRLAAIGCVVALTALWSWRIKDLLIDLQPTASAAGQLRFLIGHFWLAPEIAFDTLKDSKSLLVQLVGVLGWLDVRLPRGFYFLALAGLLCAFAAEMTQACALQNANRAYAAIAVIAGIGATYLALYLTWDPVGQLFVDGVQGRYFIPLLFGLVFTLPTLSDPARKILFPLVLTLPMIAVLGAGVSVATIIGRYY